VLLTAGPTFEAIDPVRGHHQPLVRQDGLCRGARRARSRRRGNAGCGPVSQPTPARRDPHRRHRRAGNARRGNGARSSQDVFVGVAAVADYRPQAAAEHKIKKDGGAAPAITLVQNPDILAEVAALPNPPLCVGFAAESQNLAEYAQKKRLAKKIPLIVGNLIQHGFGGDDNTLTLFDEAGQTPLQPGAKIDLARALIAHAARLLERR
jgi:phosphopantothenoylcysteine decarboxylase/phosphopantothenate--cysteine ligase